MTALARRDDLVVEIADTIAASMPTPAAFVQEVGDAVQVSMPSKTAILQSDQTGRLRSDARPGRDHRRRRTRCQRGVAPEPR